MGFRPGRNFHNHSRAQVVAVYDMDPDLLAKLEDEFQVPGYATIEEMLENSSAELVLLIVNETRRIPPLRQLLAAGRNVFTEKPLCGLEGQHRLREADAAIAAPAIAQWRHSNLKLGIDFNYRYLHHFRKLRNDVKEGRLGEVKILRSRAHFNCWSYIIDLILWILGRPLWVSVMGDVTSSGPWSRMIHIQWENGVLGSLDGTNLWGYDDHPLQITVVGAEQYAEARGLDGWYRRRQSNSSELAELWEAEDGQPEMPESFVRMADGVIKSMLADQPFPADGEAAWNELVFEAAVHQSAVGDGKQVCLDKAEADAFKVNE